MRVAIRSNLALAALLTFIVGISIMAHAHVEDGIANFRPCYWLIEDIHGHKQEGENYHEEKGDKVQYKPYCADMNDIVKICEARTEWEIEQSRKYHNEQKGRIVEVTKPRTGYKTYGSPQMKVYSPKEYFDNCIEELKG